MSKGLNTRSHESAGMEKKKKNTAKSASQGYRVDALCLPEEQQNFNHNLDLSKSHPQCYIHFVLKKIIYLPGKLKQRRQDACRLFAFTWVVNLPHFSGSVYKNEDT